MRIFFRVSALPGPWGRTVVLGLLASPIAISLACGGGQLAREAAQSPDTPSASTSSSSAQNAPSPAESGGSTTTTATLDGAVDMHGTKLTEMSTAGSTSASATSVSRAPHGHDPGRAQGDIRAILVAHRDEARACYDRALTDRPGIEGDLVVSWTIDPKGRVTQTSLDMSRSQISDPTVVSCVLEIVKKIQFAPSPGGYETSASYPFNFHPRHQRPAP